MKKMPVLTLLIILTACSQGNGNNRNPLLGINELLNPYTGSQNLDLESLGLDMEALSPEIEQRLREFGGGEITNIESLVPEIERRLQDFESRGLDLESLGPEIERRLQDFGGQIPNIEGLIQEFGPRIQDFGFSRRP